MGVKYIDTTKILHCHFESRVDKMIKRKEEREKRSERYRGIRVRKWGKWVSEIRLPKTQKRLWLGTYETAVEAAKAFDVASYCIHGRLAFLNFPNSPPVLNIPRGIRFSTKQIKAAAIQAASAPKSLSCGTDDHEKDECIPCVHSEFEPPEHNQIMSKFFESFLWGSPNDQVSSAIYISSYLGVVLMIDCVIPYDHCCSTPEFSEELYGLWSS